MSERNEGCLFCKLHEVGGRRIPLRNEHFYMSMDMFPVNEGHLEIIPFKHIDDFLDLNEEEVRAFYDLAKKAKQYVQEELGVDMTHYNVGVNNGALAGRTVHHLHIHFIPRHKGDVEDPRGGVRFVVPERGNYKLCPEKWGVYDPRQTDFFDIIDSDRQE